MEREPIENTELHELGFWRDLIKSEDWKYFRKMMADHKDHLEKQALMAVSARKFDDAVCFKARAEEAEKILQLVEGRLAEIKDRKNEREGNGKR